MKRSGSGSGGGGGGAATTGAGSGAGGGCGTTISTRRLRGSRTPSAVGTSRSSSPRPTVTMSVAGTPRRTSSSATASARRCDSSRLYSAEPEVSVWPVAVIRAVAGAAVVLRRLGDDLPVGLAQLRPVEGEEHPVPAGAFRLGRRHPLAARTAREPPGTARASSATPTRRSAFIPNLRTVGCWGAPCPGSRRPGHGASGIGRSGVSPAPRSAGVVIRADAGAPSHGGRARRRPGRPSSQPCRHPAPAPGGLSPDKPCWSVAVSPSVRGNGKGRSTPPRTRAHLAEPPGR